MPPSIVSGDIREHDAEEFRKTLVGAQINYIDTAARYVNGASEIKLGSNGFGKDFIIDTKVWTTMTGEGCLTDEAIEKSLDNSLKQLGVSQVNTLYCHAPDPATPIAVSARAFDRQFRLGKFKQLGLSNYSPKAVTEWLEVATKERLVKPSVYQGQYNLICRGNEDTLFPILRRHGIKFFGFSPLAGGFLLGGYTPTSAGEQSSGGTARLQKAANYRGWYIDEPSMHEAVSELRKISGETGIGMDELSLRWLRYHSVLGDDDAVLVGASKVAQIKLNVEQLRGGSLPEDVANRLSGLWDICKEAGKKVVEFAV